MRKVAILHPDLGIGGAERLILDVALALNHSGHTVNIYTNHHDKGHCFPETQNPPFEPQVIGDWIPRSFMGKGKAIFAYLRMAYAALYLAIFVFPQNPPDVVICDLISFAIPFLKLLSKGKYKIIFYCHHPDKLLTARESLLKKIYRYPLDYVEEWSTALADTVLVNSKYTGQVYKEAFKTIKNPPDVCYPSINTYFFESETALPLSQDIISEDDKFVILSINRYERKKNLALALKALHKLIEIKPDSEGVKLIMAGGYDPINRENIEHYDELTSLAKRLKIEDKVVFLKSPSDNVKMGLLQKCSVLVYTPSNEHFGIVPLEAMYFSKPVIAVASGGPLETIVNNVTGFLCEPNPEDFASAINKLLDNENLLKTMGEAGRKRFVSTFSSKAFREQIENIVNNTCAKKSN